MNEFQTKIEEALRQAQSKAAARAKEFEADARKVLETLADRAQAASREQMHSLGVELEKLGKKLQELAVSTKAPEAAHAADEKATQAAPPAVQ